MKEGKRGWKSGERGRKIMPLLMRQKEENKVKEGGEQGVEWESKLGLLY